MQRRWTEGQVLTELLDQLLPVRVLIQTQIRGSLRGKQNSDQSLFQEEEAAHRPEETQLRLETISGRVHQRTTDDKTYMELKTRGQVDLNT